MVYDHFRLFIGVFSLVQCDNVVLQCREFCKTVVLQREYKNATCSHVVITQKERIKLWQLKHVCKLELKKNT